MSAWNRIAKTSHNIFTDALYTHTHTYTYTFIYNGSLFYENWIIDTIIYIYTSIKLHLYIK